MLLVHDGVHAPRTITNRHDLEGVSGAVWLDLLDGTEEERDWAERINGLRVPAREEIAEIETSSRLRAEGDVLYLSTPIVTRQDHEPPTVTPLGFVLSPERLTTVRYARLPSFEDAARRPLGKSAAGAGADSAGMFLALLEAIVDRVADVLEHVGAEIDAVSHAIFHAEDGPALRPSRQDSRLRGVLGRVGRTGDLISSLRDTLLGLNRIVLFVTDAAAAWLSERSEARLRTLRNDITSLSDYDAQLTNKVQFLLDATLGFLNIEQNNGIKVLTVVSLIGIPPTLIASIYGMNFKDMPELNWSFGYPYALGLIVLSVVLPLGWFKVKGWL